MSEQTYDGITLSDAIDYVETWGFGENVDMDVVILSAARDHLYGTNDQ